RAPDVFCLPTVCQRIDTGGDQRGDDCGRHDDEDVRQQLSFTARAPVVSPCPVPVEQVVRNRPDEPGEHCRQQWNRTDAVADQKGELGEDCGYPRSGRITTEGTEPNASCGIKCHGYIVLNVRWKLFRLSDRCCWVIVVAVAPELRVSGVVAAACFVMEE